MKNLLKAMFRSSKKSIMLISFFAILIFLAAMSFGALYGTSNSMRTAYNTLASKTNLHDFTIREKYTFKKAPKYKIDLNSRVEVDKYDDVVEKMIKGQTIDLKLDLNSVADQKDRKFFQSIINRIPPGQAGIQKKLGDLILIRHKWISNKNLNNYKLKGTWPKGFVNDMESGKNSFIRYAKIFKHIDLINLIKKAEGFNLENGTKKTLSSTSYSSDVTYKMIQYKAETKIDTLPGFNSSLKDIYENTTNFEKQIIKLITDGQKGKYNKYIYIKNDTPFIKGDPLDPIKRRIIAPTIRNVSIVNESYGIKYRYQVAQNVGSIFIGTTTHQSKINPKALTAASKAGNIAFLKSYVAIANQEAMDAQGKSFIKPEVLKAKYEWWRKRKISGKYINLVSSIDSFITSGYVPKKDVVNINGLKYILVGSGLTADFTYPIVDIYHPIPNAKKQMILYLPSAGIDRYSSAITNSVKEDYIVGKFPSKDTTFQRSQMIKRLNKLVFANSNWNQINGNPVMLKNDPTDQSFIASVRIAYVEKILGRINIISSLAMVVVGALALFLTLGIVSKFIYDRQISLGIMRANGMHSAKISLSIMIFIALVSFVFSTLGYSIGIFLQKPIFKIIGNFWTLPTVIIHFNPVGLIIVFSVLFIGISFVTFLQVLLKMRASALDLIKNSKVKSQGKFFRKVKKVFSKTNIKTKYGVALLLTSSGRLMGFMLSIIASTVIIIFAVSSFNIFNKAKNKTMEMHNYQYKIDFTTPTLAGGLYQRDTWHNISKRFSYVGQDINSSADILKDSTHFTDKYKSFVNGTDLSADIYEPFMDYHEWDSSPGTRNGLENPIKRIIPDFGDNSSTNGSLTKSFNFKTFFSKPENADTLNKMVEIYKKKFIASFNVYVSDSASRDIPQDQRIIDFVKTNYIDNSIGLENMIKNRIKNTDSNSFQQYLAMKSDKEPFRIHLPTQKDEFDVTTDINFLHNMVETREFSNGNFGALGGSGIFVNLSKNLWNWIYSSLPLSTPNSSVGLSEKYALDVFNVNNKDHQLTNEYNNSLNRRINFIKLADNIDQKYDSKTSAKSISVKQLLGHKTLIEHGFIKWKAFKDVDGNLAVLTGKPAVRFDKQAAFDQRPEKNPIWSGGFADVGFIQDYNPYFASPVVSDTFRNVLIIGDDQFKKEHPQITIQKEMEPTDPQYNHAYALPTYFYNVYLQNIYQHFDAPFDPILQVVSIGISLKQTFYNYIMNAMSQGVDNQFRLFYGGIPIEDKTEVPYTYLKTNISSDTASLKFNGIAKGLKNEEMDIVGVDGNARNFVKLRDIKNHDLYNELMKYHVVNHQYPLVINSVLAKMANIKVGETLKFDVNNHIRKDEINFNSENTKNIKFKVIGISTTYKGIELYTNKKYADDIIGFNNAWTDQKYAKRKFNGIFSKNHKPNTLYSSVLTYSKSGIYGASNKILDGDNITKSFLKFLIPPIQSGPDSGQKINFPRLHKNIALIKKSLINAGYSENDLNVRIPASDDLNTRKYLLRSPNEEIQITPEAKDFLSDLLELSKKFDITYGSSLISSALSEITSAKTSNNVFSSYTRVTNSFETIIIILSLIIVTIIVLTVTMMLITSNIKSFATLKTLGYRKRDISKIFLTIYFPFLAIGIIIGIILAYFVIYLFVFLILSQSQIFLPISMTFLSVGIAILSIFVVFLISFLTSLWNINRIDPLKVLK